MTRFAANTSVPVARTQEEIQALLRRYGAAGFMMGEEGNKVFFCFKTHDRFVKMTTNMPDPKSREFTHTPSRQTPRSPKETQAAHEQGIRQRWRSLLLRVKARFEEIEDGQVTFDEAFMPYLVLPDGTTMKEWAEYEIPKVYALGEMPKLLPGGQY